MCEGGELGDYVRKHGPLPEQTIKQILSKLIKALHYLHKMSKKGNRQTRIDCWLLNLDIVHRDLKLENILLRNIPKSKTDEFDIRVSWTRILSDSRTKSKNFFQGNRFWIKFEEKYHDHGLTFSWSLWNSTVSYLHFLKHRSTANAFVLFECV